MRKLKRIITLLLCCLLLGMLSSTALAVITSAGIQIESWQDAENQDGIRPDQVDMILLRDGKEYTRVPLSDDSNWKFHLYNLPEMDDEGHAYTYTFEDPNCRAIP